jgi:hypothetical protein
MVHGRGKHVELSGPLHRIREKFVVEEIGTYRRVGSAATSNEGSMEFNPTGRTARGKENRHLAVHCETGIGGLIP